MASKAKLFASILVALSFILTPMLAMAKHYPEGDNSRAIVGVPKPWMPKTKAGTNSNGPKFPKGDNSGAIVGVPKGWVPKTNSTFSSNCKQTNCYPPGDNSWAIVGVPKPWRPQK